MNPIISLQNVSVSFFDKSNRETKVLKNINLDINKGDFITVVGHNGSGKSTLLNILAGNIAVNSGKILLDGKDITNTAEMQRAKYIRRVFQDPKQGTSPRMTVIENLMLAEQTNKFSLKLQKTKSMLKRYNELLNEVNNGLEDSIESFTETLSGGQRQTLSFLMATMVNPKLLLLDEHTAALDPSTSIRMMELTDKIIKEKNLTCLMITHNLKDALDYGNRLIVVHKGEILKDIDKTKENLTHESLFTLIERDLLLNNI